MPKSDLYLQRPFSAIQYPRTVAFVFGLFYRQALGLVSAAGCVVCAGCGGDASGIASTEPAFSAVPMGAPGASGLVIGEIYSRQVGGAPPPAEYEDPSLPPQPPVVTPPPEVEDPLDDDPFAEEPPEPPEPPPPPKGIGL